MNYEICHRPRLGEAVPLNFLRALVDNAVQELALKHGGDVDQPGWSDSVLYIQKDGMTVSFLVYRYDAENEGLWIVQAWTMPNFRGQGMYTALFRSLVAKTNALGKRYIACGIHSSNPKSRDVHMALGMVPEQFVMYLS